MLHDNSEEICLNINEMPELRLEYKNHLKSWFINFDKDIDDSLMEIEKKWIFLKIFYILILLLLLIDWRLLANIKT